MQSDNQSTGSSSSSSNTLESPQGTKSKTKDNLYRKFFKTSSGNKLLKQGQTPSTFPERHRNAEEKENDKSTSKSNKALKVQHAASARSASETRNYASSSASTPSFPILSGRQIYPQTQKVERAHLVKVRLFQISISPSF